MADLQFPWEAFMEANAQKNKQKQDMMNMFGQTLANTGQDIGGALQQRALKQKQLKEQQQNKQQQQQTNDWLFQQQQPVQKTMNVQGQQNAPIASYNPESNQTTPSMSPNPNAAIGNLKGLPPEILSKVIGPMMIAQQKQNMKPQGLNPNTIAQMEMNKKRMDVMAGRNEAWNRSTDARQINELQKETGLTTKQQSALQMNNLRADRAISILQKPNITYQELALGEIDLAGIMQGGVPHVDEVKNTSFPGWQKQWSSLKTYATGHPNENVPPAIRQKMLDLTQKVIEIDNKFLQENAQFRKSMIGPTVRGGINQFKPAIDRMTKTLTTQPGGNNDLSSMSDDELRKIAAGGQ